MAEMADAFFLAASRLAEEAPSLLGEALCSGDYADLFLEASQYTAMVCNVQPAGAPRWRLTDRSDTGFGARVSSGARQGYGWVTGDDPARWRLMVDQAADQLASSRGQGARVPLNEHWETYVLPLDPPEHLAHAEIRALLLEYADAALAADADVAGVAVEFQAATRRTSVACSEGLLVTSLATSMELRLQLTLKDLGVTVSGAAYRGSCEGYGPLFFASPAHVATEALTQAQRRREAQRMPAGSYPVVVTGGWGGVLLHEAIGHCMEADVAGLRHGYSPRIGARVGAPILTLVDDPTAAGRRGTSSFDDEAARTQTTVLIHEGQVAGLLTDRATALRWKLPRTGSGRRQDFRHLPQARMSNLRLLPGATDGQDLLAGIEEGLLIHRLGAGHFEPRDGTFSVGVVDASRIERGRATAPICGGTLSGDCQSLPAHILAVARTEAWDEGHGYCEKNGQVIPIGTAMPTIHIQSLSYTPAD